MCQQACSSIYFTMESLNQVHFLYQYSLKMFLDIFSSVLVCPLLNGTSDYTARLSIITEELFTVNIFLRNKYNFLTNQKRRPSSLVV